MINTYTIPNSNQHQLSRERCQCMWIFVWLFVLLFFIFIYDDLASADLQVMYYFRYTLPLIQNRRRYKYTTLFMYVTIDVGYYLFDLPFILKDSQLNA